MADSGSKPETTKTPAYAILDGGGVKGAALAGCLKACEKLPFEFIGYGGTSAGAIIAALAAVGYSGDELERVIVQELRFRDLLDDGGRDLSLAAELFRRWQAVRGPWSLTRAAWKTLNHLDLVRRLTSTLGLYDAEPLKVFLDEKIRAKLPQLASVKIITLRHLADAGRPALKIIASDVTSRAPIEFSYQRNQDTPIIEAIRASMCYPLVFTPMRFGDRHLADGGLSSNLPVFLFREEAALRRTPVIAFDLVSRPARSSAKDDLLEYLKSLASTAVDASEDIVQRVVDGVIRVPILIDAGIGAMDFDITPEQQRSLFEVGRSHTLDFFMEHLQPWARAKDAVQQLQARYGRPEHFSTVLSAAAFDMELLGGASVRANISLATGGGKRIVAYQWGMDEDSDQDLELNEFAGCAGEAASRRRTVVADMKRAESEYESRWKITKEQQAKVKRDLRLMLSAPLFEGGLDQNEGAERADVRVLGVFSVDTPTNPTDTSWVITDENGVLQPTETAQEQMNRWASLIGWMLTGK